MGHNDVKCSYITPDQFFNKDAFAKNGKFTILNINIRSLSKTFDKLKECIKTLNHSFTIIGLSETHLKEKPHDYYNLPGYKMEYTNRIGREKGGVCMYISDHVNYKVRKDLCHANSNYESCFIEIENPNRKKYNCRRSI
jgi:exonuclease III